MWSRLTEGLAEIVAPAEGEEPEEDPLWSRFAAVVAPPVSSSGGGAPSASADAAASLPDEDEQEQYICELERALLQRKKQNEALEATIRELESRPQTDVTTERQLKRQLREREAELTRLQTQIEGLQQDAASSRQKQQDGEDHAALIAKLRALETQLSDQQARYRALEDRSRRQSGDNGSGFAVAGDDDDAAPSPEGSKTTGSFPTLVQTALLLSSALGSERIGVPETETDVAPQLLDLAKRVKAKVETATEQLQTLQSSVTSFLTLHDEDLEANDVLASSATLESKLGVLSHRLSKAAADSSELLQLREKLRVVGDEDDEQLKKILQLQAQVSSMQATKQRSDRSLQQIASKESELSLLLEEKEATISRLQASAVQLKGSKEHLAQELLQAQAEADELATRCQVQEKATQSLQGRVEELLAANEALQDDDREVRSRAGEYEQGYVDLLAEIEKLKAASEEEKAALMAKSEEHASSIDNQRVYDLESRLSASEADKLVALQDAKRLQHDLDALEGVLHHFQVDSKLQKERVAAMETALDQAKQELQTRASSPSDQEDGEGDLQRVMKTLAKKTHECDQLREVATSSPYVDSDKKGEVLQLMARMMVRCRKSAHSPVAARSDLLLALQGFSAEQKRRVGIGGAIEGNGGGGLFSSILGLVAPGEGGDGAAAAVDPAAIQGKSFADMWSEFLLEEAAKR
ncbi:hypothetical protein BBJ28_00000700 [Nothophytophthora sp. Chile5]|nr:hypothetical protein BBJ28_00000700 [Nothophytophthora sp. Chile5]